MAARSSAANGRAARTRVRPSGEATRSLGLTVVRTAIPIAFVVLACLGLLSLVFPEGQLTAPAHRWLRLAFGWASPLVLLLVATVGLALVWPALRDLGTALWVRLCGLAVFVLAVLPALHLLPVGSASPEVRASSGDGGGWAGLWLSRTLVDALGASAAGVALALLLLVGLMVALQVGPVGLLRASLGLLRGALSLLRLLRRRRGPERPPGSIEPVGDGLIRRLARRFRRATPVPAPGTAAPPRPLLPGTNGGSHWQLPPLSLFTPGSGGEPSYVDLQARARVIEETLLSFNIEARVVEINPGPSVTQFGLEPAPGVAVNRVLARSNDLALRLGASPIRLEAPVPGKRVIGLEVPNVAVATVSLRELLDSDGFKRPGGSRLRLALGRDVSGKPVVGDLARMPHLLIAGATGSGKSVCINSIIASLLVQSTPDDLQLLMVDPKMVELSGYGGIPHLRLPVVTEMDRVVGVLKWAVQEMERRYGLFARCGARNVEAYNRRGGERASGRAGDGATGRLGDGATGRRGDGAIGGLDHAEPSRNPELGRRNQPETSLPLLVVVVDELADMMMTAADEVERTLCRLAQLGRAAGIHLVVATQRPSVDVLTGLIKANFVTRIAFAVSSQIDSRVILDMAGAEKLLGRGDMLYLPTDSSKPVRLQGAYVSDEEIQELVSFWQAQGSPRYSNQEVEELVVLAQPEDDDEELYVRAEKVAQQYARISVSLLQRRLGIGYPRAARLVDLMEERGLVGPSVDGKSRDVLGAALPE